jgi:hypothetical protein
MPDADMKETLARIPAIGIPFSQLNEAVMRGDAPHRRALTLVITQPRPAWVSCSMVL